jgi:hypothetical protein
MRGREECRKGNAGQWKGIASGRDGKEKGRTGWKVRGREERKITWRNSPIKFVTLSTPLVVPPADRNLFQSIFRTATLSHDLPYCTLKLHLVTKTQVMPLKW